MVYPESAPVDERSDVARAESVIDVDDADVRGAGVHHSEQSSKALEGCAITYARRNGNHRDADQASDYAGQRAFHSGADYDHARLGERPAMRQQAVDAGDSNVVDMLNVVAHQFRGDDCLFGDRDVAGSRGHDHDDALAVLLAITLERDGPRQRTELRLGYGGGDGGVLFLGGARGRHVAAVGGEPAEDFGHLTRRFALGKNHFGHALAQGAMVVDLGEAQVFKRQMTQALDGGVGREVLLSDLVEQLAKGFGVHRRGPQL